MNVIVTNKQKEIIDNANIDAIKDFNGLFNVDDLITKVKNYFFSKLILDATSIVDFSTKEVLEKLSSSIGADRLYILLPNDQKPPQEFINVLLSLNIYNFSTDINDIVKYLVEPNTYENIVSKNNSNNSSSDTSYYVDNSIKATDNFSANTNNMPMANINNFNPNIVFNDNADNFNSQQMVNNENIQNMNNMGNVPINNNQNMYQNNMGYPNNLGNMPINNNQNIIQDNMGYPNNLGNIPINNNQNIIQDNMGYPNNMGNMPINNNQNIIQGNMGYPNNMGNMPINNNQNIIQDNMSYPNNIGNMPINNNQNNMGYPNNLGNIPINNNPMNNMNNLNGFTPNIVPSNNNQENVVNNSVPTNDYQVETEELTDNSDFYKTNKDDNNENYKFVLGVKNITASAGSTTLCYLLMKMAIEKLNLRVQAIEVNKNDFKYYNDENMISIKADALSNAINSSTANFVVVDLNDYYGNLEFFNDVIYLVEPSVIKLNKLMMENRFAFHENSKNKLILNKSLLNNREVDALSNEAGVKFIMNIPPLNDRVSNDIIYNLLETLGIKEMKND